MTATPTLSLRTVVEDNHENGHSNSMPHPPTTPPSLFSLPYDIRHIIYRMVLQPEFPLRRWEHYMTCPGCNLDITGATIAKCTSILLTNRQIYHEASPILHNIEHLVQGLQKQDEGLWSNSYSRPTEKRRRRSGGVGKLTELEARRLRKIRFDVVFADAKPSDKPFYSSSSLPSNTTTPVSFDNPFATAHWWSPSPIPPPPPPFLEETQLSQEIPDLVRVLQSGGMIRHLTIRLRKWPRWANGKPVIQSSEFYEVPECTVEDMLEVFRPLIEFQLQGIENDEVKVRAEVYKKTENENENAEGYDNPTTKFVEKFNLARRKFLDDTNAKESAVGSSCSSTDLALAHTTDVVIVQEKKHFEVPPVVDQVRRRRRNVINDTTTTPPPKRGRENKRDQDSWTLAAECFDCGQVFSSRDLCAQHKRGVHQWCC